METTETYDSESHADYCICCGTKTTAGQKQESGSHDPVNHPEHYTNSSSGIECIDITENMNFCLGNAVKYIWRADLKGNPIEDLKKAVWYLEREITRREAEPRDDADKKPSSEIEMDAARYRWLRSHNDKRFILWDRGAADLTQKPGPVLCLDMVIDEQRRVT
jgi:hypothetical protein